MGLSEIFPSYPIQIFSPRGGNVKIASRRVYVDFPYIYWNFITDIAYKISRSKDSQKVFQKELEVFNSDEEIRKITTFNNVPLGTISLITTPFTTKLLVKLKVNWPVFFQYLENKAQELISKIEMDGSNIREVYNEIIDNYFKLVPFVPNPEMARFNIYQLENFKKLLRQLQEERDIQHSLLILKRTIRSIAKAAELEDIELWMLQLESDFSAVEKCLENIDILSCYFYLRNALENLIKLVVYNDIARNLNTYRGISQVFFFYEKVAKEKCYSIQQLKSKYIKRITNYIENTPEINLEKIYLMMIEKQFPKLSINSQTLKEFENTYNVSIKNYWSACSEIIHNQSPLPFFSLLEIKSFKHFLRRYSERFISVVKIIPLIIKVPEKDFESLIKDVRILPGVGITEKLADEKTVQEFTPLKQKLSKKAREVFRQLIFQEEIKLILKSLIEDKTLRRKVFFNPLTLVSLFHLSSPGLTRITSGEFSFEDIEYLITKIQPLSYMVKGGIELMFYTTLQILEEKMMPKLEEMSQEFSKLDEEEKKTIIFYLLAIKLPELFMSKL
jgi:hypothetical protein